MNKNNVSQRLSAQMQFKSLLLLTLLTGNASAQQTSMPPLTLDIPSIPTLNAPTIDPSMAVSVDGSAVPSLDGMSVLAMPVVDTPCETSRSTWTLRQHATWLLGLKPRQVMRTADEQSLPQLPQMPQFELQPSVAELPQLPDMSRDAVMLVQHTEPVVAPEQPALEAETAMAAVVTAAGQSTGEAAPVTHAHQAAPHSLGLRPVVSGPAPALPLETMAAESLLHVDVSGVDPSKLGLSSSPPESLIDSFGFRPPTGFSMSDSEPASLVASPAHAKPVSIHEGFAPRNSSANQAAQLTTGSGPIRNRLSDSESAGDGASSIGDKSSPTGLAKKNAARPVELNLSDKSQMPAASSVELSLSDKKSLPAASPVELNLSDKNSLLASVPVEVSRESDRSSRSGGPEVLIPPSRLAKDAPKALPLSSAMPIASTGVEAEIPVRLPLIEGSKLAESKSQIATDKPSVMAASASDKHTDKTATKPADKPVESLIDGLVPPTLLATDKAPAPTLAMDKPAPVKPVMDKPATAPSVAQSKAEPSRPAEKFTLTDANPIALKRPVVKAASVAIPDSAGPESSVVQSSHEMDEGGHQLAEYAKMAAKMQQAIKQKFPNCRVKITCNEDGLIADGHVANNTEASKVLSYVRKTSLCPVADRITTSQ